MVVIQFSVPNEKEKEENDFFLFSLLHLLLLLLLHFPFTTRHSITILLPFIPSLESMTTTVEKRQLIVRLHKKGKAPKEISDDLGVPLRAVYDIVRRYRETGEVTSKTSPGRPRLLSPREERELALTVRREPTTLASTLTCAFSSPERKPVSTRTVRRTLNRAGLHASKMRIKPRLTPAQRQARLEWARKYANRPATFWDTVIFSDESSFHTNEVERGRYVWRFPHEELEPPMVQPKVKFGGHKLQVWGCICSAGVGYPCALPEGIDGPTYVTVLEDELAKTIRYYFTGFKGVVFQQDGAGPHLAKVVLDYFRKQKFSVLPWPAHSPDLSPIENLWADLKKRLVVNHGPIAKADLWRVVEDEWNATPNEYCKNLFSSMPERLAAVIKAKGGYTRF